MTTQRDIRAAALERRRLANLQSSRFRWRRLLMPLAVFVMGVAVTVLVFHLMSVRSEVQAQAAFERQANEASTALRAGFDVPLTILESVPALLSAARHVDRSGFRAFVQPALRDHQSIAALEWLPLVRHGERERFEQSAREDGLEGFVFTELAPNGSLVPAGRRDAYVPIYFMEPPDDEALGFDILSESGRRATAVLSMSTGRVVASPRFQLIEDEEGVYSVAIYHPVYGTPDVPTTEQQRLASFRGFAVEIFRIADVLSRPLEGFELEGIEVLLLDSSLERDDERALLFESRDGLRRELLTQNGAGEPRWTWSVEFPLADRTYRLSFVATGELMLAVDQPWLLLVGGLLLSALGGLGLWGVRSLLSMRGEMARALRLGRYTLVEKLGEGGMGVVYKARHAMLRRPTALKLLRADNERRLVRFEREVQLTSQLTHPNTIAIYDYGRTPDGIFYYAMEYLEGITLQELARFDGPQPPARVVHLLIQVCGALAEAHAIGLIHRDIKPANLMLTNRGGIYDFVKVLDFGLVKDLGQRGETKVSVETSFLGTPLYLSPEAIETPDVVDHRTDIYALGAVGYALLTGQPVFTGKSKVAVLTQHLSAEPELPSKRLGQPMPAGLERAILACLAKLPEDRPPSAGALRDLLRGIDGLEPWRQSDAARWWHERADDVHEAIRADKHKSWDSGKEGGRSVDVALDDRGSRR